MNPETILQVIKLSLQITLAIIESIPPEQHAKFWEAHEKRIKFWEELFMRVQK